MLKCKVVTNTVVMNSKRKIPIKIKFWSRMFVRYHSLCANNRVQGGKSIHFAIHKQIVRWKEEHQKENENKKEN